MGKPHNSKKPPVEEAAVEPEAVKEPEPIHYAPEQTDAQRLAYARALAGGKRDFAEEDKKGRRWKRITPRD